MLTPAGWPMSRRRVLPSGAAAASAIATGELWVEPTWPSGGTWWALLGLPIADGKYLSLLWDGSTLHATQPVHSHLPVSLCKRIQIHRTDEFDFDPYL